jgi:spermidine/putrescine transport system ATP-binding protein
VTTFVANFLGQSNLIKARVAGRNGDDLLLETEGVRLAVPAARSHATADAAHVGVRPEKIQIVQVESAVPDGHNRLDGVVTDASFIGVSTQYLVRMRWGQELMVFAQNTGTPIFAPGSAVVLHWHAGHSFALDAAEDATAGALPDDELRATVGASS